MPNLRKLGEIIINKEQLIINNESTIWRNIKSYPLNLKSLAGYKPKAQYRFAVQVSDTTMVNRELMFVTK